MLQLQGALAPFVLPGSPRVLHSFSRSHVSEFKGQLFFFYIDLFIQRRITKERCMSVNGLRVHVWLAPAAVH